MTQKLILFYSILLSLSSILYGVTESISNPQALMMGARHISVGGSSAISGDVSGIMLNPASLGGIDELTFSLSTQKVLDSFEYMTLNFGHKTDLTIVKDDVKTTYPIGIGFSYGSVALKNIPEVINYYGFPLEVDSYSSGFNLFQASVGTTLYNKFYFDILEVGFATKFIQHYLDASVSSTFGLDVGVIGTYNIDSDLVNRIQIGNVIQNLVSPSLKLETGNEALLPVRSYLSLKADVINETTSVYVGNYEKGVSIGLEGNIEDQMTLRGSVIYDNSVVDEFNLGTGIIFDNINLIPPFYKVSFRLDLNYTQHIFPMNEDPSYIVSLTSLGRSIPKSPTILFPNSDLVLTSKKVTRISGIGPKNSSIRVFNNGKFYRTALTDKYGEWSVNNLSLYEGDNVIYIQSFDMLKDFSSKSNFVYIISDSEQPEIGVKIFPQDNNSLLIQVKSLEKLSDLEFYLDSKKVNLKKIDDPEVKFNGYSSDHISEKGRKLPFLKASSDSLTLHDSVYQDQYYSAKIPLPRDFISGSIVPNNRMKYYVKAVDLSGNEFDSGDNHFFASVSFPEDKHVHYNDSLLLIGDSSNLISALFVNDQPVISDDSFKFSTAVLLKPGKNLLKVSVQALNDEIMDYYLRVLRLVTYPDLNLKTKGRREIQFLSTLGVLVGDKDGNFYPTRKVTRQYLTKLIVNSLNIEIPEFVDFDLYSDVSKDDSYAPYIQVAVDNGLMYAYPDGTFRPSRELTLTETIDVLSSAGLIDSEDVDDEGNTITRAELAEYLSYTPNYEKKINRLINFDLGYSY